MKKDQTGLDFGELFISHDQSELPQLQRFIARDKTALDYRHYPSQSDIDLILIHGSGSHSHYLYPLAHALSASGAANVYTPDVRGHGLSPARRGDIDYIDQLEDDLADLISHLKPSNTSGRKTIIAGHSSGGGLALRFAGSRYGHLSDGYLFLAPYFGYNSPTALHTSGGWANPRLSKIIPIAMLNNLGISLFNRTKVLSFNLPSQYRSGTETLDYSFRLMTGFSPRYYQTDLRSISKPTIVLVGDKDEAVRVPAFKSMLKELVPNATLRIIDEVTHLGLIASPKSCNVALEWLNQIHRE